jgi:hypothetical protein
MYSQYNNNMIIKKEALRKEDLELQGKQENCWDL